MKSLLALFTIVLTLSATAQAENECRIEPLTGEQVLCAEEINPPQFLTFGCSARPGHEAHESFCRGIISEAACNTHGSICQWF